MKRLLEDPQVASWRALMLAFQSTYKQLSAKLNEDGCSIPRFQILLQLYFSGPMRAVELSVMLFVTRGNMSTFLRRLMSEGLIEIDQQSSAKTRPYYTLTAKGRELFEEIYPKHAKRIKQLVPAFTPEMMHLLYMIRRAKLAKANELDKLSV